MPLALRQTLFIFFVLFFLLCAAALLLYANGYRYHSATRMLEKTGQLILKTVPAGAVVQLNGVTAIDSLTHQPLTTPTTVPYLLSGDYTLVIHKQGFYPITRTITITSGETTMPPSFTFIEKSGVAPRVSRPHIQEAYDTDTGIMYDDGKTVYFYDPSTTQEETLYSSASRIMSLAPSPTGDEGATIDAKGEWAVFDHTGVIIPPASTQSHLAEFRWLNDTLYARTDHGIAFVDQDHAMLAPLVTQKNIADFYISGDTLYAIVSGSPSAFKTYARTTGEAAASWSDIPPLTRFEKGYGTYLVLEGLHTSVYLFDTAVSDPVFQEIQDARGVSFIDENHFLTYNDFELWRHTLESGTYMRTLVTRQSVPITALNALTEDPYAVSVSAGHIIRIRDLQATTTPDIALDSFERIVSIFLNKKQTAIIIVGTHGKQSGIFEIPIIEREQLFPLVK